MESRLRRAEARAAELEADMRMEDAERRVRTLQLKLGAQPPSLEQRIGDAERRLLALPGIHSRGNQPSSEASGRLLPLAVLLSGLRDRWAMLAFFGSLLFWSCIVLSTWHPSTRSSLTAAAEVAFARARMCDRVHRRTRARAQTRVQGHACRCTRPPTLLPILHRSLHRPLQARPRRSPPSLRISPPPRQPRRRLLC